MIPQSQGHDSATAVMPQPTQNIHQVGLRHKPRPPTVKPMQITRTASQENGAALRAVPPACA